MGELQQPFIGSEALSSGVLTRYELRRYHRALMPDVYLDKRVQPSLRQRTLAAYLWSRRQAVVSGLAASAVHGAKWIDDGSPVELLWHNARSPRGVITRDARLFEDEHQLRDGLKVTWRLGIATPAVCVNSRRRWASWMRAQSRPRKRGCGCC